MTITQKRYLFAFIVVALLLGGAAYLQIYQGVTPCSLCILQRLVLAVLGIVFLIGIAVSRNHTGKIIIGILSLLVSTGGALLAGRQVWLQQFSNGLSSNCEVSIEYLLRVLPIDEAIQKIFQGSSTCSQTGWEFMHISLALWSLGFFILFLVFSVWQLRRS